MPKFYDNWCEPSIDGEEIVWKINLTPEQINSIDPDNIWDYSIESVNLLLPELGSKPALCLSGGIDSQVMVDCFRRANVAFDVVIMRFPDDLNLHDIKTAMEFCNSRGIKYSFIDVDVVSFLSRELMNFAEQYDVSSPQFATHFKMFEQLQQQGYTSAVCGGNTLINSSNGWTCPTTKEQNDWRGFSDTSGFYVMGDFLSYYWKFSILLSCHSEKPILFDTTSINLLGFVNDYDNLVDTRYLLKVSNYRAAGFDIIPQETKFTGFEKVKEHYQSETGDGWTFEKCFRFPLMLKNPSPRALKFSISDDQENALDVLYDKCVLSRSVSPRITD